MPRFDGPYAIKSVNSDASTVTLHLPKHSRLCPTFHMSRVRPFVPNDAQKYPLRKRNHPNAVWVDGVEEVFVDKIVSHRRVGRGFSFLVHFLDCPEEEDEWFAYSKIKNNSALDTYLVAHPDLVLDTDA